MPAFDIVSRVDLHELTNAVDQAGRELDRRYDLRGTNARFELEGFIVTQFAPSEYLLDQLLDILRLRLAARAIDPRCLELGPVEVNLAGARRQITVRQGIEPVSYTHLDVYKRQGANCVTMKPSSSKRALVPRRS